ncbi:hypothetical protein BDW02DRAFT_45067 [Decorospora gaudefroyi]|uniref:Uncharacterized protein n=1 Tax=Decorospora gaudefroyi TaxID=184978 RepID=A0A6A5KAT5_9PLEO|nr:hypothetical protein BDW02DRAFT_45067 [Decorospora gaudefroyi]
MPTLNMHVRPAALCQILPGESERQNVWLFLKNSPIPEKQGQGLKRCMISWQSNFDSPQTFLALGDLERKYYSRYFIMLDWPSVKRFEAHQAYYVAVLSFLRCSSNDSSSQLIRDERSCCYRANITNYLGLSHYVPVSNTSTSASRSLRLHIC